MKDALAPVISSLKRSCIGCEKLNKIYQHTLRACLRYKWRTVIIAFSALIGSLFLEEAVGKGGFQNNGMLQKEGGHHRNISQ